MANSYIEVTEEAGKRFFNRPHDNPVVMLNMLKFKKSADYSESPHLAPTDPISGFEAYNLYIKNVYPILLKIGSEVLFSGFTDDFLIGPIDEKWDSVILVRHHNLKKFMLLESDKEYLAIKGHRTAALADSRLLPIHEAI